MTPRSVPRRQLLATVLVTASLLFALTAITVTAAPAFADSPCSTGAGGGPGTGGPGGIPEDPEQDPSQEPQLTPEQMEAYVAENESRNGLYGDPHVYLDSAVPPHPTVGVGFNLDRSDAQALLTAVGANYAAVRAGTQNLTPLQIITLFKGDYRAAVANVGRVIPNFDALSSARQVVLIDMMYNLGPGRFGKFTAMINAVKTGNFLAASVHMQNSKWATQVGNRATKDMRLMTQGAVCNPGDMPRYVPVSHGGGGGWATYPGGIEALPWSGGNSEADIWMKLRNLAGGVVCYTMTVTVSGPGGTYSASSVHCV
ncbi:hypothetical protein SAMN05444920_14727 [Nonomuraea solani]|uniref:Lysozyme n=1 Tax=Nonomuraea solani TaxID=1144553 RepID=A0A1H6F4K0_9ACTN|nr:hypothetical protein [Nonomuraea solani]SEH03904.1 hypothetical protein SAMN05444920_14727 [Nonomuraea solani]